MSYYEFDNRYMLDMIKLYPDRFVGTAIVDPLADDPGTAMRGAAAAGRARLPDPAAVQQAAAGDAGWSRQAITPCSPRRRETGQALSCLIDPTASPRSIGCAGSYPDDQVIIDHLGRIGVDGHDPRRRRPGPLRLATHPSVFVKVGAFYALGKKTPPYLDLAPLIRRVVQAFGARRCMWESDCPFQVVSHRYEDSIALIRDRLDFLSKDDRDWLLFRTAEQTLFQSST